MPLVIIVDDDLYVRASLENLLASVGYSTIAFPSAEAFLAVRLGLCGDCLVLDVEMKGMSGLVLQQELMTLTDHTPTIFLSAHCDDKTRAQALRNGALAFVNKPFEEQELLSAIELAVSVGKPF